LKAKFKNQWKLQYIGHVLRRALLHPVVDVRQVGEGMIYIVLYLKSACWRKTGLIPEQPRVLSIRGRRARYSLTVLNLRKGYGCVKHKCTVRPQPTPQGKYLARRCRKGRCRFLDDGQRSGCIL